MELLESAKFHGIFIVNVLSGYDIYKGLKSLEPAIISGAQWPISEPLAVIPTMAAATKNLGFRVTVATTCRLGWNIITGYHDSAARNLGHTKQPRHDKRYAIAEEYLQVIYKLFESSWRDDAIILNKQRGIYSESSHVRQINHKGKYYTVPGPHICRPSPQHTPPLLQAGTSKTGKTFAAQHAEAIFVAGHSPSVVAKNIAEVRQLAKTLGEIHRTLDS